VETYPAICCIFICAHCYTKICLIIIENALSTSIGTWLILLILSPYPIQYITKHNSWYRCLLGLWRIWILNTVYISTEIGHMTIAQRKIEKAMPLLVLRIWFVILQNSRENFRKMLYSKWFFRRSQRIMYNCYHFYWIQPNHEKDFSYFISATSQNITSG